MGPMLNTNIDEFPLIGNFAFILQETQNSTFEGWKRTKIVSRDNTFILCTLVSKGILDQHDEIIGVINVSSCIALVIGQLLLEHPT